MVGIRRVAGSAGGAEQGRPARRLHRGDPAACRRKRRPRLASGSPGLAPRCATSDSSAARASRLPHAIPRQLRPAPKERFELVPPDAALLVPDLLAAIEELAVGDSGIALGVLLSNAALVPFARGGRTDSRGRAGESLRSAQLAERGCRLVGVGAALASCHAACDCGVGDRLSLAPGGALALSCPIHSRADCAAFSESTIPSRPATYFTFPPASSVNSTALPSS